MKNLLENMLTVTSVLHGLSLAVPPMLSFERQMPTALLWLAQLKCLVRVLVEVDLAYAEPYPRQLQRQCQ